MEGRSSRRMRRRPSPLRWALLAGVLAGGAFWCVRSGALERALGAAPRAAAQTQRRAGIRARQEQAAAAREAARAAQLDEIRDAIARQKAAADRALAAYRAFLEEEGTAALAVRRETREAARRAAQEAAAVCRREAAAAGRLERALAALARQTTACAAVARDVPPESATAAAYAALERAAAQRRALDDTYTARHPAVVAGERAVQAARERYRAAVARDLERAAAARAEREAQLARACAAADEAVRADEAARRACEVARLREEELSRARTREADLLADLRRRALEIQFGVRAASPDAPAVRR